MEIKLSSDKVLIACSNYFKNRKTDEELIYELDCHSGWSMDIIGPVLENDLFFSKLRRMAHEVNNSQYSYIIINDNEWELIEKNLNKREKNVYKIT